MRKKFVMSIVMFAIGIILYEVAHYMIDPWGVRIMLKILAMAMLLSGLHICVNASMQLKKQKKTGDGLREP